MAQDDRQHYFSLRDLPKFEGLKGELPNIHLMEFEDYLAASGIQTQPILGEDGNDINPNYTDIVNKFKASLKNKDRL